MKLFRELLAAAVTMIAFVAGPGACIGNGTAAAAAERRLALVIGESAYGAKPAPTAANDAGLIAQTLQAAGFDVTGARDLEEAALRQSFRDFLDKAAEAGPDAVVFIYFSGYGLQLEGENYLLPVDVQLTRDVDIPLRALRVSDYLKPLAASAAKLSVVVLDAARENPFHLAGEPLAGGLALFEPGGRTLLAYNAAPGTIAPPATGDYGPYAHALAEMIRDGGAPLMDVFENTRLRVSEMTKGGQIPWNSQKVQTDFVFFQRDANAPARVADAARIAEPIKALGPEEGFSAALRRDTLQGYEDYVATYPAAPYAKRALAILAARREALTWRRSRIVDTPNAYWTYLRRYPKGPHAWDARRRLAELRAELEPPPSFEMIEYGYPPPPPEEIVFVDQPVVYFDDPMWGFVPPPPPPVYLLPPPPPDFVVLPPPIIIAQPYVLPAPQFVPIPVWQRAPAYIAPPPNNFIFGNVHNAIVVDPRANSVLVRDPAGAVSTGALTAAGAGAAVAVGAALPSFLAKRNGAVGGPPATPAAFPPSPNAVGPIPGGQPHLPGRPAAGAPNAQPLSAGSAGPAGLPPAARGGGALAPAAATGHALPVPGAGGGAPGTLAAPGRAGEAPPVRESSGPGRGGGIMRSGGAGSPPPADAAGVARQSPGGRSGALQPLQPGQGFGGAPMQPAHRGGAPSRGVFPGEQMGRPGPMREPLAMPAPGMRDPGADRLRPPGFPHSAIPGGGRAPMPPPQMRAAPPEGMMPPQMRQMAPPAMHAPPPDRGPQAGMMRAPPQQPAPAMIRPPAPAPAMMRPPAPAPAPPPPSNNGGFGGGHGGGRGGFGGPGGPPIFGGPH